ncbi:MAG: oligoendopeptidase F [candidate division Zixibacteria bacterium]
MSKMKFSIALPVILAALIMGMAATALAEVKKVPQRSDVDDNYKWKLEHIYADTVAWLADYEVLQSRMNELETYKGRLGESADILYECLQLQDELNIILGKLYVYANMKQDEDTRISEYQQLGGKIGALDSRFMATESYIGPEILEIPSEKLMDFLSSHKGLKEYSFYLEDLIRTKKHILSPAEESILALAGDATGGTKDIFRMLYYADIKFPTVVDENGDEIELTRQRYSEILKSPNREVRRNASKAYNKAYEIYFNTIGAALTSKVKINWFYAQVRKYNSALAHTLDDNNIPPSVVTGLVDAVNANLAPLHKWMSIRKKVMGLDELHGYDTNVPLVPDADKKITFDDAKKILAEGLKPMGKDYLADLKMGLNSGWIDVYETEGKRGGGYKWGSYSTHPYILMNYNDNIEGLFTLSHEMGHAMHSFYSQKARTYRNSHYATFVAEVASITNETIMIRYMINNAKDKQEKMSLLYHFIDEFIGTFYFQTLLTEFELAIHNTVESGEALSAEGMKQLYTDLYQKYWGPEMVMDEWGGWGAMRMPHFFTHRPYYVFQYATSHAAALALSKKIVDGDKETRKKYLEFLTWGGNNYPVEQLKKVGVDMTTPGPINDTAALFSELVDEMEQLLDEN